MEYAAHVRSVNGPRSFPARTSAPSANLRALSRNFPSLTREWATAGSTFSRIQRDEGRSSAWIEHTTARRLVARLQMVRRGPTPLESLLFLHRHGVRERATGFAQAIRRAWEEKQPRFASNPSKKPLSSFNSLKWKANPLAKSYPRGVPTPRRYLFRCRKPLIFHEAMEDFGGLIMWEQVTGYRRLHWSK